MHELRTLSYLTMSKFGKDHQCVKVKLGGSEVLLWKADKVIDDSSLMQLDVRVSKKKKLGI